MEVWPAMSIVDLKGINNIKAGELNGTATIRQYKRYNTIVSNNLFGNKLDPQRPYPHSQIELPCVPKVPPSYMFINGNRHIFFVGSLTKGRGF